MRVLTSLRCWARSLDNIGLNDTNIMHENGDTDQQVNEFAFVVHTSRREESSIDCSNLSATIYLFKVCAICSLNQHKRNFYLDRSELALSLAFSSSTA